MRLAKAESEAALIKATSEIATDDLKRRALARVVLEETRNQANIESITGQAIKQLTSTATPQDMDTDWVANFLDNGRHVSDAEMRLIWARLLVEEANTPGTFSRRTVNLLDSLDKYDARLFTKLCGFIWKIDGMYVPLIHGIHQDLPEAKGLRWSELQHLESIGLLTLADPPNGFMLNQLPQIIRASYFDTIVDLVLPEAAHVMETGEALLTKTGQELMSICGADEAEGFADEILEQWYKRQS